jgi:hypothetical protein
MVIHPDTELRSSGEEIGLGVFATRAIPRGTVVWALDELDQRFDAGRVKRLGPRYARLLDRYGYCNAAGERVLCWDLARWVNHSCTANVLSCGWEFDIAIRDIADGEEITNDYGALNLDRGFACRCRQPACRGTIRPRDFERLADRWDGQVREAFTDLMLVPQPLWQWVTPRRAVVAAVRRPERLPSVRRHRYVGDPSTVPVGGVASDARR